jgi:polar amino acid transport system substrate-binding protein
VDSLKSIKLANFPNATWKEEDVNDYVETAKSPAVQMIYGEDPIKTGIRMLLRKRVDACLTEINTARYYGTQMGLNLDEVAEVAGTLSPTFHYIGFSPNNPKSGSYIRILDQGMKQLRASGELADILKKYSINDWSGVRK